MTSAPTSALVRAVLLGCGTAVLALLTGRPELLVPAAPFLVWSVLGVLRRPPASEQPPTVHLSATSISAGQAVGVTVTASASDRVVDAALRPTGAADLEPEWGAVCDVDTVQLKVRPRRWGRLDLDPVRVTVTDVWGMWAAHWQLPLGRVDVSPSATVPGRGDAIPHPIGMAGIHASPRPGDGSALADIRRFQPGDRLNRINWRVTSRTGILHTNATSSDRDTDVLLVADTLQDVTTGDLSGPYASSLDETVSAVASLAEHYLRLGDRVGVHDLGRVIGDLPPRTGVRQYSVLTAQLGRVSAEPPRSWGLRPVGRLRPGTFAVVCTPLLDSAVLTEIATLTRRGAAVLVVDTLPERLGRLDRSALDHPSLLRRLLDPVPPGALWEEAWALRRLERDADVQRLREVGIPVAPWQGVGGIAALAATLATQRPAARTGGAR